MKKLLVFLIAIGIVTASFASTIVTIEPKLRADKILIPVNKTGLKISLLDLSRIKIKDFETLRGQKMKFFDRLAFKAAQKKVRESIDNDGTINNKKLNKALTKKKGGETGFHVGGFALGFLLGLIGVLIAYLIKDDYKQNRVKWAWLGFGVYVAILLVILAAGVSFV